MSTTATYKTLSQQVFENIVIKEKEPSILVFGAEWSGNSEIMDSMMERVSQEFESDLHFFKVDIEKQLDISSFFGIADIPTTIMIKDGEIIELIKGFTSASKIRKKIKNNFLAA